MKKIVIIGSNSFSGSSFISYVLEEGFEVLGISRSEEKSHCFLPYKWIETKKFIFRQLDLNVNTKEIVEEIEKFEANYIINFAAQSMVAESWKYPEQWYQTNVVSNVVLFEKLVRLDFVKKYLHVSTPEVYGSCTGMVQEHQKVQPSTPYATSRAACDLHLSNLNRVRGFPVVFTRAANVFGPGQQLYRIIPKTILFILTKRKLQLHGGGGSLRSFIHIRDVSKASLDILLNANPPNIFHLSTDKYISIRDLVRLICTKMNANFESLVEISPELPGKDAAYLLSSSKANKELNWKPEISLEDGLEETIEWVSENLDILLKEPFEYIHKK